MNKSELVNCVVKSAELSKASASIAVEAVFDCITVALQQRETVTLVGFGTFGVKDRPARSGRNPRTGAEIQIPASRVPSFKAGKSLKEALNQ